VEGLEQQVFTPPRIHGQSQGIVKTPKQERDLLEDAKAHSNAEGLLTVLEMFSTFCIMRCISQWLILRHDISQAHILARSQPHIHVQDDDPVAVEEEEEAGVFKGTEAPQGHEVTAMAILISLMRL